MSKFTSLSLFIDSLGIPSAEITQKIVVARRENEAASMNVILRPASGLQNLDSWAGKSITLDLDGVRIFTGVIDRPVVDLVAKTITLICTDKRREVLNTDLAATISTIGFYSDAIFNEVETIIEELDQRLTTVTSAADILPDGVNAITSILPKSAPDFTLVDADVLRRNPVVSLMSRGRITNQVNLNFDFRYTRFRHRERGFRIEDYDYCTELNGAGLFSSKETLLNNANQLSWMIDETTVIYEELPPSGLGLCGNTGVWFENPRYLATAIEFNAATRYAQTITENFSITVKAPQSITQYGLIDWDQKNGFEVKTDSTEWERFELYITPTGGLADVNDYYIDNDGLTADYDNAISTAINIANTKIIKSHRDLSVTFDTHIKTGYNLTHTIYLNTATVKAQGKITALTHNINVNSKYAETTTEITLSTAQGAQVSDALNAPVRPLKTVIADPFVDPIIISVNGTGIDTPAIDDTSRNEQIVSSIVNYDIEIQNDTFSVTL